MKKYKTSLLLSVALWGFSIILCLFFKQNNYKMINKQANIDTYRERQTIKIENKNNFNRKQKEIFFYLTPEEKTLVESIVAGEAGIEPYEGKVAVANCILNACIQDEIRPEEVQSKYKYAGWKDIDQFESECLQAYGNANLADEVREAVSQVFDNGEILSNEILWFCSGYSEWHESQKFVVEISNHRFFGSWN